MPKSESRAKSPQERRRGPWFLALPPPTTRGEATHLPLSDCPEHDYLAAIGFLAALAFPESIPARNAFVKTAIRHLNALHNLHNPHAAKLQVGRVREIRVSSPITRAATRIEKHRLPAAEIAAAVLVSDLSRRMRPHIVVSIGGMPIRSTRAGVMAAGSGTPSNVYTRTWASSKPVLHLALALRALLLEPEWAALVDKRGLWGLIERPDWVRTALRRAKFFRLVASSPFKIPPEKTVQLIGERAPRGKF